MKFRKKPIVVDAWQWKGITIKDALDLMDECGINRDACSVTIRDGHTAMLKIHTLEGEMLVSKWDWIIKGIAGEYYPCKPDIFSETYEFVAEKKGGGK